MIDYMIRSSKIVNGVDRSSFLLEQQACTCRPPVLNCQVNEHHNVTVLGVIRTFFFSTPLPDSGEPSFTIALASYRFTGRVGVVDRGLVAEVREAATPITISEVQDLHTFFILL